MLRYVQDVPEDEPRPPRYPRSGDPSASRHETPNQQRVAESVLPILLSKIDELASLDDRGYFELEPTSTLAVDDAAIYPLKVSSAPRLALISAIDHLQTVATLVRSGTLPMVTLVTILRSAIETGCAATYYLAPPDRVTRVTRAIQDYATQISDRTKAMSDFGHPLTQEDVDAARALGQRAVSFYTDAGDFSALSRRGPTITDKITAASPIVEAHTRRDRTDFQIRGLWRAFSGMTHGREYAAQIILDREELGYDDETGTVTVNMTFGAQSLAGTLAVVLDVIRTAVWLYGTRSSEFTNHLEDVELAVRLRTADRL